MISAATYADQVQHAWGTYLERQARGAQPHDYVYASAYRICDRRMVYELTASDQLPPFPAEVLAKFRRGEDRERDLLADLARIGRDAEPAFQVVAQQQRFELKDHKGRVAIVGKTDARLQFGSGAVTYSAPLEIKAWSPLLVDKIETFADLFDSPWTRSGGYQLLSYMFAFGVPFGFLLLDRSGLPKLLPVELDAHLDRMEEFLARAERVLDHVAAGTLPDFIDDPAECKRCPWYGQTCNPPLSAHVAQVLTDPDLEAALERREQLKAAAKEFTQLDDQVKRQLRGVESGLAGAFRIVGRWSKQTRVELPEELKKQYLVTNPKGKFSLEIVRL